MNPYSESIERLITLKDMHRGELELSELDVSMTPVMLWKKRAFLISQRYPHIKIREVSV